MDGIQKQITGLNQKIDHLHEIVEHLSGQIATMAATKAQSSSRDTGEMIGFSEFSDNSLYDHKDILRDSGGQTGRGGSADNPISDEIQIRRLTAQLTAAYNRIAALEEQLLTYRIHS
ncbi:hypothetical protein V0288_19010 [Pannus brasiliensis CCIBt3594]|uniref:Uncharacterized protein n=1 Tax=Pannus brasiliensis CCIBt3594 TaxID=1427578 RepID=A0AAW9R0F8_9CHRO